MGYDTVLSAIAAGCSAVAAWKSLAVARSAAMASEEARRRETLFDIAKTARLVALEAGRAIEIADYVTPQIDSHTNLVNAYHGSARVQMQARLAAKHLRCRRRDSLWIAIVFSFASPAEGASI